jgi:N-glycosylase/DNA lyase
MKEIKNKTQSKVYISDIQANFDLLKTLDCGQCFRWKQENGKWAGVVSGNEINLYFKNNVLSIESTKFINIKFWKDYFDLNLDYNKINEEILDIHPLICEVLKTSSGIRILKQDPWEVLCSFIISQNNNIPRIKNIIERLCVFFGEKIKNEFSFPSADAVSCLDLRKLDIIKAGFRSNYLIDAAVKVKNKQIDFEKIKAMNLNEARKILQTIKGVGPKIADCVLLYGFHKLDAFPRDVWINKAAKKFFPDKKPEFFGKYAGVIQQYFYYWIRKKYGK